MKKSKREIAKMDFNVNPTRYYKCVDCGYLGDFGFVRQRNLVCEKCNYDLLVEFDIDEFSERYAQRLTNPLR